MEKSKVFFIPTVSSEAVVSLIDLLSGGLTGKIGIKVHSGEQGNQNFISPDFWAPAIEKIGGTVVECNTAYQGARNTTSAHLRTLNKHGWTRFPLDLMDKDGEITIPVKNGKHLDKNYVGATFPEYGSMLVLSHFKGHPMGGFGGALKNISIGLASSYGKQYIHGAGNADAFWSTEQDVFLEAMAESASSVIEALEGRLVYINVMCNLSVDCDCCAVAADPEMGDIGVLASLDPVALDQACVDLVYASKDPGKVALIRRMEEKNGIHILEAAEALGIGSREYERIDL